jgi:hypothetical protein
MHAAFEGTPSIGEIEDRGNNGPAISYNHHLELGDAMGDAMGDT